MPSHAGKFFLGTDSAPHQREKKRGEDKVAAGVFTQPYAVPYVLDALAKGVERGVVSEADVTVERLEGFLAGWGRAFYGVEDGRGERILLKRGREKVVDVLKKEGLGVEVVPFRRGEATWSVTWK
jgi:dihydroorotase